MTDYKTIKGGLVKAVSSDPSNPFVGEVWFNTTTNLLKVRSYAGAWSSGGSANTARSFAYGGGTQTAALLCGGEPKTGNSEEYNGSAWSEGPNFNTPRFKGGLCGIQTAAVAGPGNTNGAGTTQTEEYDGSSWTNVGNANNGRNEAHGFGTQTAGCIVGGADPSNTSFCEEYNGSTWSEVENCNVGAAGRMTGGTLTAGLAMGGGGLTANTEEYDGTDWTEAGELSTARQTGSGLGIQTAALAIGGADASTTNTTHVEEYDGSSFSTQTALPVAKGHCTADGAGTTTTGLMIAGDINPSPTKTATCEEWDKAAATHTVTHS